MSNTISNKRPIISREFILVSAIAFLVSFNFLILIAIIPRYAIEVFQMSETYAGIASGLFVVGMVAARLITGRYFDKFGFRPMLLAGTIVLVVLSLGYFIATIPAALFAIRFFSGFAFGMISNINVMIISAIIPRERSGEGVGYYSMIPMMAWAAGPYIGVNLSEAGDYATIFLLSAILPGIALILIPFLRIKGSTVMTKAASIAKESITPSEPDEYLPEPGTKPAKLSIFDQYLERSVLGIAVSVFLQTLFFTAVSGFAAVYALEFNVSNISFFFLVFVVALLATRPLASKLFDRYNAGTVIIPCAILIILGFIVFSQMSSFSFVISAAILFGIGVGGSQSSHLALTVKTSPRDRIGTSTATYYVFLDCGGAIGPVIGGLIIELSGYRSMYICGAVVTFIGLLFFWWFVQRKKRLSGSS